MGCCNLGYPLGRILNSNLDLLPITYSRWNNRFDILRRVWQISKRFINWNGSYGQKRFRALLPLWRVTTLNIGEFPHKGTRGDVVLFRTIDWIRYLFLNVQMEDLFRERSIHMIHINFDDKMTYHDGHQMIHSSVTPRFEILRVAKCFVWMIRLPFIIVSCW